MRAAWLVAMLASGCASNPCDGLSGSCVDLTVVGCADGTSVLTLSVTSDGEVANIDHLALVLTDVAHNRVAKPVDVTLDAPQTLPPARSVALVLPATVHAVHIDVSAIDVNGVVLSASSLDTTVTPGKSSSTTVSLPSTGGGADLGVEPDLGNTEPDMVVLPPDLATPCTVGALDLPDDNFADVNCDGIDGDVSDAVFVDPTNGNDVSGDGTRTKPLQHLGGASGAVALALTQRKHQILVAAGTIAESAPVALFDGLGVYGGYNAAANWARSDANAHPVVAVTGTNVGIKVPAQTVPMQWDRVDVTVAAATAPSSSTYAMLVLDGALFTLSSSTLTAGDGAPGTDATSPAKPPTPPSANAGVPSGNYNAICCQSVVSDTCMAGVPGTTACGGFPGAHGGKCGDGTPQDTAGGPSPGANGGLNAPGTVGGNGANGMDAPALTSSFGTVAATGYTPPAGTAGAPGLPGSGGGGGGIVYGGSCSCGANITIFGGAGGGAGGCGGPPGTAAGSGGGSFALFLWNANATLDRVRLIAGNGGKGGNGAAGAPGMTGGLGGVNSPTSGGNGGNGGKGGTSSGGAGGPSICVEQAGSSTPVLTTTPDCTTGVASAGGMSPNPALAGPAGIVAASRVN